MTSREQGAQHAPDDDDTPAGGAPWLVLAGARGLRFVGMRRTVFIDRARQILKEQVPGTRALPALANLTSRLQAVEWLAHPLTRAPRPAPPSQARALPASMLLLAVEDEVRSVRVQLRKALADPALDTALRLQGHVCNQYLAWLDRVAKSDDATQAALRTLIDGSHAQWLNDGGPSPDGPLPRYAEVCAPRRVTDKVRDLPPHMATLESWPAASGGQVRGPELAVTEVRAEEPWLSSLSGFAGLLPAIPGAVDPGAIGPGKEQPAELREALKLLAGLHVPIGKTKSKKDLTPFDWVPTGDPEEGNHSIESRLRMVLNHWTGTLDTRARAPGIEPALPTFLRLRLPPSTKRQRPTQSELVERFERVGANLRSMGLWICGAQIHPPPALGSVHHRALKQIQDLGARLLACHALLQALVERDPRLRCEQCFRSIHPGNQRFCKYHTRQHTAQITPPDEQKSGEGKPNPRSLATFYRQSQQVLAPAYCAHLKTLRPALMATLVPLARRLAGFDAAPIRLPEIRDTPASVLQRCADYIRALQELVDHIRPLLRDTHRTRLETLFEERKQAWQTLECVLSDIVQRLEAVDRDLRKLGTARFLALKQAQDARTLGMALAWPPPGAASAEERSHALKAVKTEVEVEWSSHLPRIAAAVSGLHPEHFFADYFAMGIIERDGSTSTLDVDYPGQRSMGRRATPGRGALQVPRPFSPVDLCEDILHLAAWGKVAGDDVDKLLFSQEPPLGSLRRAAGGGTREKASGITIEKVLGRWGQSVDTWDGKIPKDGKAVSCRQMAKELGCSTAWISKLLKQWHEDRAMDPARSAEGSEGRRNPAAGAKTQYAAKVQKRGKLPVKYSDEHGNTWSGRGLLPRWLRLRLSDPEDKREKEDFRVSRHVSSAGS